MRKRIGIAALLVLATVLMLGLTLRPTLAYMTDNDQTRRGARAGTIAIEDPGLRWLASEAASSETTISGSSMTVWNPGAINTLQWGIASAGNKSIDLRYTIRLYWNEGPGLTQSQDESADSPLWAEQPFIYLYPSTMADEDITLDLNSGNPSAYLAIGTSDVKYTNASGSVRYGYSYTYKGATLDGVGDNAETGDATIPGATSDLESFKVAFAPDAPAGFMGRTLVVALYVEGKQHRNTTDSDWSLVSIQAIQ